MTPEQARMAEEQAHHQLEMSKQTLEALRRHGLTDETEVQIDFYFVAPNEKSARSLAQHLEENDCLELQCEKSGGFLSRKWAVMGKSHPTPVTESVLATWIPWMVVQGISHDCEFDGWGASV
jgi:Regulator of ribonuclease activity B